MLFTSAHKEQLQNVGFTRVEGVIPAACTAAVLNSLSQVSHIDFQDPTTWYLLPATYPGIIPSHHHQSQWDIRQHSHLHQVFSELWGTRALWVTMDRIGFVPPRRPGDIENCEIHWDMDPRGQTIYQAIVYLTDVTAERAPFCAVPQVFQDVDAWLAKQPENVEFSSANFSNEPTVAVPGKAGDLIIWNSKLPHGPGANRAANPRVMQAVTMLPPLNANWTREEQISWWRTKRAPPWWRDVPGQMDPEPGEPATLSELGQRLVGMKQWND